MGLLSKPRQVITQTPLPVRGQIGVPDERTFKRYAKNVIPAINSMAALESEDPVLRESGRPLALPLFAAYRQDLAHLIDEDDLMPLVVNWIWLGLGYARVDSGFHAPAGCTDERTQCAMVSAYSEIPPLPQPVKTSVFFALMAGHYVGRCGNRNLDRLLTAAVL